MNARMLSDYINNIILPGGQILEGPVLFLIDNEDQLQHVGELMPRFLSAPGRKGWETVRIAGAF